MLTYPAMINSLLLSPKDAATDEIQLKKHLFVRLVFLVAYNIFQIVNVFAKVPPFTVIINPSPSVHMN